MSDTADLQKAIKDIDARLQRIEDRLFGASNPMPAAAPSSSTTKSNIKPQKFETRDYSLNTSHMLAIVAVLCFVLAGTFIVKLAIDSGWLTPFRQWGLLGILGFVLIGVGRFFEKVSIDYRSYLSAAGIIVLYIASYAASLYFGICSAELSLLMGMGVTLLCLGLFHFHRSEIFPIVAATGTYLAPLMLGSQQLDAYSEAAFFLVWAAVFSVCSTYFKTRTMSLVASYLGLGVYTLLNAGQTDLQTLIVLVVTQILQFVIFGFGVLNYSTRNKSTLSENEAWSYFPVLCFFYGTTYFFLNKIIPDWTPWIALGFAAFVFLLYRAAKKTVAQAGVLASAGVVQAFMAVVIFQAGYLQILPDLSKPWLLAFFLVYSFLNERGGGSHIKLAYAFKALGLIIGLIEFLKICVTLVMSSHDNNNLLAGLATFVIGIVYYLRYFNRLGARSSLFLCGVHVLAVLALYRLATEYGSLAVSLAWAVYATTILVLGYVRKDTSLARSSLIVLVIAALKALVYDAAQAATGIRILCLLVTGILLYGTGVLFQKMATWKK